MFIFRFAMHELGLSSRRPFKKSAKVVGEVRKEIFLNFTFVDLMSYFIYLAVKLVQGNFDEQIDVHTCTC